MRKLPIDAILDTRSLVSKRLLISTALCGSIYIYIRSKETTNWYVSTYIADSITVRNWVSHAGSSNFVSGDFGSNVRLGFAS